MSAQRSRCCSQWLFPHSLVPLAHCCRPTHPTRMWWSRQRPHLDPPASAWRHRRPLHSWRGHGGVSIGHGRSASVGVVADANGGGGGWCCFVCSLCTSQQSHIATCQAWRDELNGLDHGALSTAAAGLGCLDLNWLPLLSSAVRRHCMCVWLAIDLHSMVSAFGSDVESAVAYWNEVQAAGHMHEKWTRGQGKMREVGSRRDLLDRHEETQGAPHTQPSPPPPKQNTSNKEEQVEMHRWEMDRRVDRKMRRRQSIDSFLRGCTPNPTSSPAAFSGRHLLEVEVHGITLLRVSGHGHGERQL